MEETDTEPAGYKVMQGGRNTYVVMERKAPSRPVRATEGFSIRT